MDIQHDAIPTSDSRRISGPGARVYREAQKTGKIGHFLSASMLTFKGECASMEITGKQKTLSNRKTRTTRRVEDRLSPEYLMSDNVYHQKSSVAQSFRTKHKPLARVAFLEGLQAD